MVKIFINNNRVHIDNKQAALILHSIIHKHMVKLKYRPDRKLIVVCVGTDRSTGDSLGPLTGTFFEKIPARANHHPGKY